MYSIRSHSAENPALDLPTTMYSVQPIIGQSKVNQSTNGVELQDIEKRQDILLEKLEYLHRQLVLYQKKDADQKSSIPVREELVIHLSAKQPSPKILNLIDQFHDQLSIRTYRHSSLNDTPAPNFSASKYPNTNRALTIIWGEGENLPFMFYSHMKIHDEQMILNLLSNQLTSNH